MNNVGRDYTNQLSSLVQQAAKHVTFDVWVRKEFLAIVDGVVSVSYWNTAKDVPLRVAVEIGGNWLEDSFPSAPHMGYRLGSGLETRFIHRRDDKYRGVRYPYLIIKPHDDLAGQSVIYFWRGEDFEAI